MTISLEYFAAKYGFTVRRDPADGTEIIRGSQGNLYEFSDTELGVMFLPKGEPRTKLWNSLKRNALAVGMTLRQNGEAEGAFSFNPADPKPCRVALTIAGVKKRRKASTAQLGNLRPFQNRFGLVTEGLSAT